MLPCAQAWRRAEGSGLARCALRLRDDCQRADGNLGAAVMADALEEPLRVIAANAGFEPRLFSARSSRRPRAMVSTPARPLSSIWRQAGIVDPVAVLEAAIMTAAQAAALP